MRGIDYLGTLIMWLVVLIGWLIKGGKTNLLKEIAKIDDSAKRNVGIIFVIFFLGPIFLGECRGNDFNSNSLIIIYEKYRNK